MTRTIISVPMRGLSRKGLIAGPGLDYGSGKGYDARAFWMEQFDPHYSPEMPGGRFETIVCNYVLNVIESEAARLRVLRDIQFRLTDTGQAYITVRTDKAALNGTTSIGTWQGLVVLNLPVVQRGPGFVTYLLTKSAQIGESEQAA